MGAHMIGLGMNDRSWVMATAHAARAAELRIAVHTFASGARVVDAGVDVAGGLGAGRLLAELCLGGLGQVDITTTSIGGESWSAVHVWTDHPACACLASQYAGWIINPPGYFAMGSGPLRARARVERDLFEKLAYAEDAERGVLVLETRTLPGEDVVAWLASRCGVRPDRMMLFVAPTASVAGGLQVVARVVETALHKMDVLGFDVKRVVTATGTAPIPPIARNDLRAIGRTNDCVLYGGQVRCLVQANDDELRELAGALPSSASSEYGTPFYDIFERAGRDFYKIDPRLFSPAEVWLTSAASGRTFHAGGMNPEVLRVSLYGG